MKKLLLLLLTFLTIQTIAQEKKCYSIELKNTGLVNSKMIWESIKIRAPKDKLISFLRSSEWQHSCNFILNSPENILKKSKEENFCNGEDIYIEFSDSSEFLEYYNEISKVESFESEICINSNGEISFSINNGLGGIQINSKGNVTLSAKTKKGLQKSVQF